MGELLARYGGEFTTFRRGQIVEGSVVAVDHKAVLVDVGAKSEGIITGSELTDSEQSYKQLKPGDLVLSVVVQPENRMGYIVLSLKRAEAERKWREMNRLMAEETPFEVRVLEYGRGGLLVDALGLRGFVPISHLNRANFAEFNRAVAAASRVDTVQKLGDFVGKTLRVKVIELDRNQNRLVLSEKELEPKVSAQQVRELLAKVKVGDEVDGVVTGVMPFGLFVEVKAASTVQAKTTKTKAKGTEDKTAAAEKTGAAGSDKAPFLEGLVHISEISWEKVNHPADHFKVGNKIKVKIIGKNETEGKLALSIKQLLANPWEKIAEKYPVGKRVKGQVSKIVPFGAFVTLEPGIDGLIHVSETVGPLKEGEKVEAVVIVSDPKHQRLGLSVRQIEDAKIYR